MSKHKRIDELVSIPKNLDGKTKKKKEPSKPPANNKEAESIFDALWNVNQILSLCCQMQSVSGLRYSDSSWLKYTDFIDDEGRYKKYVDVIQQKIFNMKMHSKKVSIAEAINKSTVRIYVNASIKEIVAECRHFTKDSEYLFANKKSAYLDEKSIRRDRPMSVQSASEHHLKIQKKMKLDYSLGTHSWRKLFAKNLLENGASIVEVRDLLGHSSLNSTNSYLHSFSERLSDLVQKVNLG